MSLIATTCVKVGQHILVIFNILKKGAENYDAEQKCWASVTYDTRAAYTFQSAPTPRRTLQDLTSASSAVFALPAHMSRCTHSSQTKGTACTGWYLQTNAVQSGHTHRLS